MTGLLCFARTITPRFFGSDTFHIEVAVLIFVKFQGEEKTNKVSVVPGQLLCLEHAVQQEYFAPHHASLLQTFMSK